MIELTQNNVTVSLSVDENEAIDIEITVGGKKAKLGWVHTKYETSAGDFSLALMDKIRPWYI